MIRAESNSGFMSHSLRLIIVGVMTLERTLIDWLASLL